MTTAPPDDVPDIVALDENHAVMYAWYGCPDVTELAELPVDNRMASIAIADATLIRRRDGLVLKAGDRDPSQEVPTHPAEPQHLERVDLIPPPEPLTDVEPLDDAQMIKVALWTVLKESSSEDPVLYIDDRDLLKAMAPGSTISIERLPKGEGVVLRAHSGSLVVIPVGEAPDDLSQAMLDA